MLCLSRKIGESIELDGGIKVTPVRISGDRVRLAIEAPESTKIWRTEAGRKESRDALIVEVELGSEGD